MRSRPISAVILSAAGSLLRVFALWVLPSCFTPALANSVITPPAVSDPSISMLELEAELFGLDPSDFYSVSGSNPFFNAGNSALYGNLAQLILELGGDQAMIAQLFQGGGAFAQSGAGGGGISGGLNSNVVSGGLSGGGSQASAPEPATIGLLGGTLLFLSFCAFHRTRRLRMEAVPATDQNADSAQAPNDNY